MHLYFVLTHHPSSRPAEILTITPNLWISMLRPPSHNVNLVACSRPCSIPTSSTNTSDTSRTPQVSPRAGHEGTAASILAISVFSLVPQDDVRMYNGE